MNDRYENFKGEARPQPDAPEAKRMVETIFRQVDSWGWVCVRRFPNRGVEGAPETWWMQHTGRGGSNHDGIAGAICAAATLPGHVVAPPVALFRDKRADEASLAVVTCIHIDCDQHPDEELRRATGIIGAQPTLVVATGSKTENGEARLHAYWLLAEHATDQDGFRKIARAGTLLARVIPTLDASAASPVHPMRWAGTINDKSGPVVARIVGGDPESDIDLDEALAQIEQAAALYGLVIDEDEDDHEDCEAEVVQDADDLMALAVEIPNDAETDWYKRNLIGMAFWRTSAGSDAGLRAFHAYSGKHSGKYDAKETDARWRAYDRSRPDRIGLGTLLRQAHAAARLKGASFMLPSEAAAIEHGGQVAQAIVDTFKRKAAEAAATGRIADEDRHQDQGQDQDRHQDRHQEQEQASAEAGQQEQQDYKPEAEAGQKGQAGAGASGWPEPVPLVSDQDKPRPYPIQALPPVMRDAVTAYQRYGQQPVAMVACSALGAASLVVQGLVDVGRDVLLTSAASLSILVIAESGERKTAADRRMAAEIRAWEREAREEAEPEVRKGIARRQNWEAKLAGIRTEIKKTYAEKLTSAAEANRKRLEAEAEALEANPTVVPAMPRLFIEDATPEAIAINLAKGWPSTAIWSDEAGVVVGGAGMNEESFLRYVSLLNRCWDAPEHGFRQDRVTRDSIEVRGRRVTVNLMMQRQVAQRFFGGQEGVARGVGALARFLICQPESTMGSRAYRPMTAEPRELLAWDHRLRELLEHPLPIRDRGGSGNELYPPILRFTEAGFAAWRAFYNKIEMQLAPAGEFATMRDFASKIAEQAARIAAIFHVIEHGPGGAIGKDAVEAGCVLAEWHLVEARRVLGLGIAPDMLEGALVLLDWLKKQEAPPSLKDILQFAPNRVRNKKRRDAAITMLTVHALARLEDRGGTKRLILSPRIGEVGP
jgi:hypothetical protein